MALVAAARAPDYPAEVVAIVSSRPDAAGLAWARAEGLPATCIDPEAYASRQALRWGRRSGLGRGRRRAGRARGLHAHPEALGSCANGTHVSSTSTPHCCPPSKASIHRRRRLRPGSNFRLHGAFRHRGSGRRPHHRPNRGPRVRGRHGPSAGGPNFAGRARALSEGPGLVAAGRARLSDGRVTILPRPPPKGEWFATLA